MDEAYATTRSDAIFILLLLLLLFEQFTAGLFEMGTDPNVDAKLKFRNLEVNTTFFVSLISLHLLPTTTEPGS